MNDDELERLARDEILRETQRASIRADQVGPQGWKKCPVLPANKRFLRNMIVGTLPRSQPKKRTHDDSPRTNRDCRQSSISSTEKRPKRTETRTDRHAEPAKRQHKALGSVCQQPDHIEKHFSAAQSVSNDQSCATVGHSSSNDIRPTKKSEKRMHR